MTYKFDGYNWLVRFDRGDLLVEQLTKLVKSENIRGAWVSGLGGAQWAELGFYDLNKKAYHWKRFDQLMEITSIQGNVAWDGEPTPPKHGGSKNVTWQAASSGATGSEPTNGLRRPGEPILHMHATLSDETMQAYGGHIKELQVGATCEILLHRWYDSQGLKRAKDSETGLKLLSF
jgi:uncharacterized protein